jgi:hypothetical protein
VQVAAWLHTTPEAVRVARHGAYRALRAQLCPAAHLSQDVSGPNARPQARKHFLGTPNILPSSRPL